jgi:hypothetical protein
MLLHQMSEEESVRYDETSDTTPEVDPEVVALVEALALKDVPYSIAGERSGIA